MRTSWECDVWICSFNDTGIRLTIDQLRAAVEADGLVLDESKLMPMDTTSITKRDRRLRPLQ